MTILLRVPALQESPRRLQIIRLSTLARQHRAVVFRPPVASDISKGANCGLPPRFLKPFDRLTEQTVARSSITKAGESESSSSDGASTCRCVRGSHLRMRNPAGGRARCGKRVTRNIRLRANGKNSDCALLCDSHPRARARR